MQNPVRLTSRSIRPRAAALALALSLALAACGGGSGSSDGASSGAPTLAGTSSAGQAGAPAASAAVAGSANVGATSTAPSIAATASAAANPVLPVLPVPANVASGSTVQLECGRIYAGTLDVGGKSNITVTTAGSCGNATITPGRAITGWTQYQGSIYSAPVSSGVAQVLADGQPLAQAHWPNRAQTWATASSAGGSALTAALPNNDVAGATLLFRANDWAIEARKVTAAAGGTLTLASTGNVSFDGYPLPAQPAFYLEGKLWMLDEPGEWVVSNGRLYVWMPDGLSPEGRIFAAPDSDAINAQNAKNISIGNVNLFASANGINGLNASGLRVTGVNIANSSENGILNSGGSGLYVDGTSILNSRHDAIAVKWGGGGELIQNSTIDASGTIGMPTNAHAAINVIASDGPKVHDNVITRAGYIGVHVSKNASVAGNKIDTACMVLSDCGGIYVEGPAGAALNTVIDGNTILNVGGAQKLAWAIDLDVASQVTISNNTISNNANGMQLHNAAGNTIAGNRFSQSAQAHIQMDEDGATASMRNNAVKGNTFNATHGEEVYRISSTLGAGSVAQFASYDGNDYTSSASAFANFNGDLLSFTQWKAKTGQDAASTFRTQ